MRLPLPTPRLSLEIPRPLSTLLRTIRCFLKLASLLFLGFLIFAHITATRYYLQLPAGCLSPGMEPYHEDKHCSVDLGPEFQVITFVKPGMQLLDGSPPKPVHWADFEGLYELQRRMIEHMINATVYHDPITLESVSNDVLDQTSALYQFQTDFRRRDYRKERVLRETLFLGGRLGRVLIREYGYTKLNLERLVDWNRKVAEGVEKAMEKQPRSFLAQVIANLFPRFRTSIWSWDTDIEVRWQYYDSLTLFSWRLYKTLLALDDLLPKLEAYEGDLKGLNSLLIQEPGVNTTLPSAHAVKATPLPPSKTARFQKVVAPNPEEDERLEVMKRTVLEGLMNARQVASDRVGGAALMALRALSEELESTRHRVAEPGRHVPLFVHLRHIYIHGERLGEMLKKMK